MQILRGSQNKTDINSWTCLYLITEESTAATTRAHSEQGTRQGSRLVEWVPGCHARKFTGKKNSMELIFALKDDRNVATSLH